MKKLAAIFLVIAMLLTLTGCTAFSYWDGMTYNQTRRYICKELKEKYGEEFTVLKSGGIATGGIWAYCAPKSDESLVFEINAYAYGKHSRDFRDAYIQAIVRNEMKNNIDEVLSKYYDNFASEIYVEGLLPCYDSGIRSSEKATIKNYSEAIPESNNTGIWIVLNEEEINDSQKVNAAVNEIVSEFYLTHAHIHFCYANNDIINQCKEKSDSRKNADRLSVFELLEGHFPYDAFVYVGSDENNKLAQVKFANK